MANAQVTRYRTFFYLFIINIKYKVGLIHRASITRFILTTFSIFSILGIFTDDENR